MKHPVRYFLALAALLIAVSAWFIHCHSESPLAIAPVPPPPESLALQTNTDSQEVFRRAFWREPAPNDKILHAERREWVSEENGVRVWQWFLAVEPAPELVTWLREQNPFNLAKSSQTTPIASRGGIPAWFPATAELNKFEVQQASTGGLTLLYDATQNRLYATDTGHGFAIVYQKVSAPAPNAVPLEDRPQLSRADGPKRTLGTPR